MALDEPNGIKEKLMQGEYVQDNEIFLNNKTITVGASMPNQSEAWKILRLRKKGISLDNTDFNVVAIVRKYTKGDVQNLLSSKSWQDAEVEKLKFIRSEFSSKEVFFYPELVGKIKNRKQFVDLLLDMQYMANFKTITALESDIYQKPSEFEKELKAINKKYENVQILPSIDLWIEAPDGILNRVNLCKQIGFKTILFIYRGYSSSIYQLIQTAVALSDKSIKGILAETKRATSLNKIKLCTSHLAKFFGINASFIGYPKYILPNAIIPIMRLIKDKSTYYIASKTEVASLKRTLSITDDSDIYDFTRIEDISITNGLWQKPSKEKAIEIINTRTELASSLEIIS
jgi:hypothetical protein